MPSVYHYRHVELDKVGRGKRVIQPPGGQTADIFGSRSEAGYSSASSQAGSDVASSRVHIETDQQSSLGGASSSIASPIGQQQHQAVDGVVGCQVSPNGSLASSSAISGPQNLLLAEDFKPTQLQHQLASNQQQQPMNIQQQKLIQMNQQSDANRSPKKTIPTVRRNPITGEIYDNPSDRQPAVVRVRQPPGGRSSGIF